MVDHNESYEFDGNWYSFVCSCGEISPQVESKRTANQAFVEHLRKSREDGN